MDLWAPPLPSTPLTSAIDALPPSLAASHRVLTRAIDALPPSLTPSHRAPKGRVVLPLVIALAVVLVSAVTVPYVVTTADTSVAVQVAPKRHEVIRTSAPTPTTEPSVSAIPPPTVLDPPTEPPSQAPLTTAPITVPPTTSPPPRQPQEVTAPVSASHVVATTPVAAPISLSDPATNIFPSPNFLTVCSATAYDDSYWCVEATLAAIDNARQTEGLGTMTLPTNWPSLTPAEQLFVVTNLERTARGLAPLSAMASALDADATQAALAGGDAAAPAGFPWTVWGTNWAGQIGNPLEAVYYWMYDDGLGSSNQSCSVSTPAGCWGHRNNMLLPLACGPCVLGAAWEMIARGTSLTEILVDTQGSPATDFTWAQEQAYLP